MVLVYVLFAQVFLFAKVPTESMTPTIEKGQYILCSRKVSEIEKDDVIVFKRDGILLVKRVAGCPGDTVMVDGKPETVPEACYYMLGDNPDNSIDSRYWTNPFLKEEKIVAKVILPSCDRKE